MLTRVWLCISLETPWMHCSPTSLSLTWRIHVLWKRPAPYGGQAPYGAPNQFGFGTPPLTPDIAPLPGASFGDAAKRYFQRYAQFHGYASPSEFWWSFLLYQVIIPTVLGVLAVAIILAGAGTGSEDAAAGALLGSGLVLLLYSVYALVILVPSLAVMVRRLHDNGKSGWFILLGLVGLGIVPLILCCFESRPDLYRPEWS